MVNENTPLEEWNEDQLIGAAVALRTFHHMTWQEMQATADKIEQLADAMADKRMRALAVTFGTGPELTADELTAARGLEPCRRCGLLVVPEHHCGG